MFSIWLVFGLYAINGWFIEQVDAKNAFLNGELIYKTYFKPTKCRGADNDEIRCVKETTYDLNNAPLIFYHTFTNLLIKKGFESLKLDSYLLFQKKANMYVDDSLIVSKDTKNIKRVKSIRYTYNVFWENDQMH